MTGLLVELPLELLKMSVDVEFTLESLEPIEFATAVTENAGAVAGEEFDILSNRADDALR